MLVRESLFNTFLGLSCSHLWLMLLLQLLKFTEMYFLGKTMEIEGLLYSTLDELGPLPLLFSYTSSTNNMF